MKAVFYVLQIWPIVDNSFLNDEDGMRHTKLETAYYIDTMYVFASILSRNIHASAEFLSYLKRFIMEYAHLYISA